jgi:Protein of unknown function (DUF2905)
MNIGRMLILAGLALVALGLLFLLFGKLNIPLGRLPGDVVWRGRNTTFYFPVVTCILLSLLATFLLWLFNRR